MGLWGACSALLLLPLVAIRAEPGQGVTLAFTQEFGVTHVQMLGEVRNSISDRMDDVIFHAFVRLRRYQHEQYGLITSLYGIGWIESITTGKDSQYAPEHLPYVDHLPAIWLTPVPRAYGEPEDRQEVQVSKGSDASEHGSKKMGIRLSAAFNSLSDAFYLQLEGWSRYFEIPLSPPARPGLITPWFHYPAPGKAASARRKRRRWKARNLQALPASHGSVGASSLSTAWTTRGTRDLLADVTQPPGTGGQMQQTPGAAKPHGPPLVVVTCLIYKQPHPARLQFLARQLIRHVEYHLVTLSMQRYLVYVTPSLWLDTHFRGYVEHHMPAALLPFITFVLWNDMFQTQNYPWYYDQHIKFYHADVALWGHDRALAALIDVDEYLAFPAPAASLHQALHRCNASDLDWVRLPMVQHACDACVSKYASLEQGDGQEQGTLDMDLWHSMAAPEADGSRRQCSLQEVIQAHQGPSPSGRCSWWRDDPLRLYNRSVNDGMYLEAGATPQELGTPLAWDKSEAKHLIRGSAMVAFMHHRGQIMPNRTWAWMDPAACPSIAHLAHLNGFRALRAGAHLSYFMNPAKASNWWLVDRGTPLPEA